MDLKFRADLLGRSVLYLGYGFGDLNIKVIWFRLNEMMGEVPGSGRPASYIVAIDPNPVLQELYKEVGLETIVLDPEGSMKTQQDSTELLADFVHTLARNVCQTERPYNAGPYLSATASRHITAALDKTQEFLGGRLPSRVRRNRILEAAYPLFERLASYREYEIPQELTADFRNRVLPSVDTEIIDGALRRQYTQPWIDGYRTLQRISTEVFRSGPSPDASTILLASLLREQPRASLDTDVDWTRLLRTPLAPEAANMVISHAEAEVDGHENFGLEDLDVFYSVDLCRRIATSDLGKEVPDEQRARAQSLVERTTEMYPDFAKISVSRNESPEFEDLADAVTDRLAEHQDELGEIDQDEADDWER